MFALLSLLACGSSDGLTKEEKAAAAMTQPAPEAQADAEGWSHWGQEFQAEEVVAAADLLADPAQYEGRDVRVEGRVAEVCQQAGCWMVLAEGDQTMRVMMKDHGFSVGKDIAGQDCQVEGHVTVRELDPEFIEHLEGESTNKDLMPEKNAVDGKVYEFEAVAVASRS